MFDQNKKMRITVAVVIGVSAGMFLSAGCRQPDKITRPTFSPRAESGSQSYPSSNRAPSGSGSRSPSQGSGSR